jgi:large subunit ribosomal protein L9
MKIILLEDVKSLGKRGDIVNVSDGYARNMILPKKLGVEANNKNMNELKLKQKNDEKKAQGILEEAKTLAAEINQKQVELKIKTGEGGKTFGSISTKEIATAAKSQHDLDIDKKKMQLSDSIKSLGFHEVQIKLHPQVTATLKVHVTEE